MTFFNEDLIARTRQNEYFRQEIRTDEHSQIVVMSIQPGDDVGEETHTVDQILFFVSGQGESILNGQSAGPVSQGRVVVVPAGTLHNFKNTGSEPMKLFTIYAPPEEEPGTLHKNKAEALAAEQEKETS